MGGVLSGNGRTVLACVALVAGMGAMSYAAVPLYQLFCQVTGYGGTTRKAEDASGVAISDREVTVRFDANTSPGLDWAFYPEQRSVTLRLGETARINYYVENRSHRDLSGTATFNVTPQATGAYFNKIECFCFTRTDVAAGETLQMPVVFFVDPEMIENEETGRVSTITLSYTFFPDRDAQAAWSAGRGRTKADAPGG